MALRHANGDGGGGGGGGATSTPSAFPSIGAAVAGGGRGGDAFLSGLVRRTNPVKRLAVVRKLVKSAASSLLMPMPGSNSLREWRGGSRTIRIRN